MKAREFKRKVNDKIKCLYVDIESDEEIIHIVYEYDKEQSDYYLEKRTREPHRVIYFDTMKMFDKELEKYKVIRS